MFLHFQTSRKLLNSGLLSLFLLFCSLLCACTPSFNWRDVHLDSANGSTLKAALPCKPDSATRPQPLGDVVVQLGMMGCIADEVTFTLSHIALTNTQDAPKILAAWQAAGTVNVRAKPAGVIVIPAVVRGASAWPPTVRQTIDGETTQAHMLWFAKQTATGVTLYQAAMYGKQLSYESSKEATTTFFESLQVP